MHEFLKYSNSYLEGEVNVIDSILFQRRGHRDEKNHRLIEIVLIIIIVIVKARIRKYFEKICMITPGILCFSMKVIK